MRARSAAAGLLAANSADNNARAFSSLRSGNFVFTTMDPNQPAYWQERWELYKHTYVVAGWGWARAGAAYSLTRFVPRSA